jgi:hypothetical protein
MVVIQNERIAMKAMIINISYGNNNEITAKLNFDQIPAYVYENARYLVDDICDGYCHLDIPNEAHDVFSKHGVKKITDSSNPKLMKALRKIFINDNIYVSGKKLENREIEVDVSNDKNIQSLFKDEKFQELNKEFQKLNKSKQTTN